MVEIMQIPSVATPQAWKMALPLLKEPIARTRGCYEEEDVFNFCCTGAMGLWLAVDDGEVLAAYVVEIVQYPRKRRLRATFAGAKPHSIDRWFERMVAALNEFRAQMGCDGMEAMGRRGWSKFIDGEEVASFFVRDYPAMELH